MGPRLCLWLTQEEHFSSGGLSVPSCSELRLDEVVAVAVPAEAALPCCP